MPVAAPEPSEAFGIEPEVARPTLADALRLSERLGDLPPERILLDPAPGRAGESDLLHLLDGVDKRLCELIDATLVEKPMGFTESVITQTIGRILGAFVAERGLGVVSGSDGTLRLFPGLVLIPDVAFIEWARLPERRVPDDPMPELVPNLVIEVLSRSNTAREMERKRRWYFARGVDAVWQIDPASRQVAVFSDPDRSTDIGLTGVVSATGTLAGLEIPVAAIFAGLADRGA